MVPCALAVFGGKSYIGKGQIIVWSIMMSEKPTSAFIVSLLGGIFVLLGGLTMGFGWNDNRTLFRRWLSIVCFSFVWNRDNCRCSGNEQQSTSHTDMGHSDYRAWSPLTYRCSYNPWRCACNNRRRIGCILETTKPIDQRQEKNQ